MNVGRDIRLSSPRLHDALLKGLLLDGLQRYGPRRRAYATALFLVRPPPIAGSVMITGSHNPAEYNGFKVMAGTGTIHGEEIQQIFRLIQAEISKRGREAQQHTTS